LAACCRSTDPRLTALAATAMQAGDAAAPAAAPPPNDASADGYNDELQRLVGLIVETTSQPPSPRPASRRPRRSPAVLGLEVLRDVGAFCSVGALRQLAAAARPLRSLAPPAAGALEAPWVGVGAADDGVAARARARSDAGAAGGVAVDARRRRVFAGDRHETAWAAYVVAPAARRLGAEAAARAALAGGGAKREKAYAAAVDALGARCRLRFAAQRKDKVGRVGAGFFAGAPALLAGLRRRAGGGTLRLADDVFAFGGGFAGLVIERLAVSLGVYGADAVLVVEASRFEERAAPDSGAVTIRTDAVRCAVGGAPPVVLCLRDSSAAAVKEQRGDAPVWAALAAALGVAEGQPTRDAVRDWCFAVCDRAALLH